MSSLVRNYHSGIKLVRPSHLHNNYLDTLQMQPPSYEPVQDLISVRAMTDQKILKIKREQL